MLCFRVFVRQSFGVAVFLGLLAGLRAADTSIAQGTAYLAAVQNANGSWGGEGRELPATAEVCQSLLATGGQEAALGRGLLWLYALPATDHDKAARKLAVLHYSNADVSVLRTVLLAGQNADGGWGLTPAQQANVEDTLLVLAALPADVDLGVWSQAAAFLAAGQSADGAWLLAGESSASTVARTARAALALDDAQSKGLATAVVTTALAKAQSYLGTHQAADGSFGTLADSAWACLALLRSRQPADLADSLAYLAAHQESDGSWGHDPYTTAIVLRALQAVQPPAEGALPDLAVTADGIVFTPAAAKPGDVVTLTATIFNRGQADAGAVVVEFFNGDPRLGGTAIGQPQSLAGVAAGASATAAVGFDTTGLLTAQRLVVFVDRGNALRESSKLNNAAAKDLPIGADPDLSIAAADLNAAPAAPEAFAPVQLRAVVRNLGGEIPRAFVVRFLDGTAELGEFVVSGLGLGAQATLTLTAELPAGAHSIVVQADPENALDLESNRANNQATLALTVAAPPVSPADLAVEALTVAPESLVAGKTAVLTLQASNRGGMAIETPFNVVLRDNGSIFQNFTVPGLPPGGQATLTVNLAFPAGTHALTALLDPDNAVSEADEANNQAQLNLTVAAENIPPDLRLVAFAAAPAPARAGEPVTLRITVANLGSSECRNVVLRLTDGEAPVGADLVLPSVAGGGEAIMQVETSFAAGSHALRVVTDPDNAVAESDEGNNNATLSLLVKPAAGNPDLEVTTAGIVVAPGAPQAFQETALTVSVRNVGQAAAEGFVVRFADNGSKLADLALGALGAGQTGVARLVTSFPAGTHTLRVTADPDGSLADETERGNNQAEVVVTVAAPPVAPPDLRVEPLIVDPAAPLAGAATAITVRVINAGGEAAGAFSVALLANGEELHRFAVPGLAAGQRAELTLQTGFAAGDWQLLARVDADAQILESDESNNQEVLSCRVASTATPPDLVLAGLTVEAGPLLAGDVAPLTVSFRNAGTRPAENVLLRLSVDGQPLGSDLVFGALAGGQDGSAQVQTRLAGGSHVVLATLDPANTVNESDESNNSASLTVVVQTVDRPDLQVSAADLVFDDPAPVPGATVGITVTVHNLGALPSTTGKLLLTLGDPYAGGALLIAEPVLPALAAGAQATVTAPFVVPGEGSFAIYALADSGNEVIESNEDNNLAIQTLTTAPLPDLYVDASAISLSHTDLAKGQTVAVRVLVTNLGAAAAPASSLSVTDTPAYGDAQAVGTAALPALAAGEAAVVELLWQPGPGTHVLRASVDPTQALAEHSETNNQAELAVTLTAPAPRVVILGADGQGGYVPQTQFHAYESIWAQVTHGYPNARVVLTLAQPGAEATTLVTTAELTGFSTRNLAVGTWTVAAQIQDLQTKTVLGNAGGLFEILPTTGLRGLTVFLDKDRVEGGVIAPIGITVTLANGSNVATEWGVSWTLLAPDGSVAARSTSAQAIALAAEQGSRTVRLAQSISGTFTTAGLYTLLATAEGPGGASASGSAKFSTLPVLRLNVANEVQPASVAPLEQARVKTVLRVSATGGAGNLAEPAAIGTIRVAPSPLGDASANAATVTAGGIVNIIGDLVPDGTPIVAFIPYGTLAGGTAPPLSPFDAAGTPPNPQIRIYGIAGGAVSFGYSPAGGALAGGQRSLTVVEFHVYHAGEADWLGKLVGFAEIPLNGQ